MKGWWLLLLLVPSVAAVEPALAPVAVASEEAGGALQRSVDEAVYDGTADDGATRLALLSSYVRDFDSLVEVPPAEDYSAAEVRHLHGLVAQLVSLAHTVPQALSAVESTHAACTAEGAQVSLATAVSWSRAAREVPTLIAAAQAAIRELIDTAPELDSAGLQRGLAALDAWQRDAVPNIRACVFQVEEALNITSGDFITVQVVPTAPYPGGRVGFLGATSVEGTVQMSGPAAGSAAIAAGSFTLNWTIPASQVPGPESFAFTAGSASTQVTVDVGRAPTDITVTGPRRVLVGQEVDLRISWTSPLPAATVPTMVSTLEAPIDLVVPHILRVATEAPGFVNVTFSYPGDLRHGPAAATWRLEVVEPVASEATPAGRGLPDLPFRPADLITPWWLLVPVAAYFVFHRKFQKGWFNRDRHIVPHIGTGLVGAVGGLMAWLTATGRSQPGMTAREVHDRVAGDMADPDMLSRFESERYGRSPATKKDTAATRWAWRVIGALRREK